MVGEKVTEGIVVVVTLSFNRDGFPVSVGTPVNDGNMLLLGVKGPDIGDGMGDDVGRGLLVGVPDIVGYEVLDGSEVKVGMNDCDGAGIALVGVEVPESTATNAACPRLSLKVS